MRFGLRALAAALVSGTGASMRGVTTAGMTTAVMTLATVTTAGMTLAAVTAPPAAAESVPATRVGSLRGTVPVPPEARPADVSRPTTVVGRGTPASCTSQAFVGAVARGGVITFSCGPRPVTIRLTATAKVRNTSARVVVDGGGKVTLSGAGRRRILYMNTCDRAQVWTTSHCDDQPTPALTLQNLTFADGDSTGQRTDGGGGGAVFARGGRLKVVNSRFVRNRCDRTGPDLGGAAIRVLDQWHDLPVYVAGSSFENGVCSNGGALSGIGVSWQIVNSVFIGNRAVGRGANPATAGTPGGGNGGAVYADGNRYAIRIAGSLMTGNHANEGGGAVFFVSNDRSGSLRIERSTLRGNVSGGFETRGFPGVFYLGAGRAPQVVSSTLR
ncbi:hypothetical protein OG320_18350 [Microbispora sp. NBC_01189]|uniref:hypothetical protein n=1 Tax=Microbispora sp. NBC_01189 TaxID=2903583 RepID=UPI002E0ED6B2|nr:hypothetical protein OG320_18350 [Microbispora sp. NBC_01189]